MRRFPVSIVENSVTEHCDFTYWLESRQALQFREVFKPAVICMDYRLADLENGAHTGTTGLLNGSAPWGGTLALRGVAVERPRHSCWRAIACA